MGIAHHCIFNVSKDQPAMSRFVRTFKARKAFLDELEVGSSVSFAARAAGGTTQNFKKWRADDENFAADWDEAEEAGTDHLEDEAYARAVKKSDPLMMFMLKARRPEKFDRASKIEHSGGIDVTGARTKLLNKIARLQAEGKLPGGSGKEESEIPEAETAEEQKLLPAPSTDLPGKRGSKRRAAEPRNRRKAAA
jgi:hypothetical protein